MYWSIVILKKIFVDHVKLMKHSEIKVLNLTHVSGPHREFVREFCEMIVHADISFHKPEKI